MEILLEWRFHFYDFWTQMLWEYQDDQTIEI